MNKHWIEIDDDVWDYLKKFAEPFVDTPNSVLRRLLLDVEDRGEDTSFSMIDIKGVPKALSQIFEVLYEIEVNGCSRIEATHKVAQKRGTAPQTVIDKYCRQLNKRAHEIDQMLNDPDYVEFKEILKEKFITHRNIIDLYFETLTGKPPIVPLEPVQESFNQEPPLEL
jgi:hypothetical protein